MRLSRASVVQLPTQGTPMAVLLGSADFRCPTRHQGCPDAELPSARVRRERLAALQELDQRSRLTFADHARPRQGEVLELNRTLQVLA
jgi:hypothetical protein